MRNPCRVRVTGPLMEYAEGFGVELAAQGYVRDAAARQLRLTADLSGWLAATGVGVGELASTVRVDEFLEARRAGGNTILLSRRALMPLVGYLRSQDVVRVASSATSSPMEALVEGYRCYLVSERALAERSVCAYLGTARLFLAEMVEADGLPLERLTAAVVTAFVVRECRQRGGASAQALVTGLRSLLRFLFLEGHTACQLAAVVPTVTSWAGGSLPRALGGEAVTALVDSCDPGTVVGLRDRATLTVLARLGLRACEVAGLELDDLDWRRGEIVVRGKGGRQERLPMPVDVGEAVVAYLHDGRPRLQSRALFLRVHAPLARLSAAGVGDIVRQACRRAGVPAVGPHALRHGAATSMLRGGASLAEVGQVLRHARLATTSIYAKVDRVALRTLAQPWPGCVA